MEININRGEAPRCPFCHEAVEGGRQYECKTCHALHHTVCWDEKPGCAACAQEHTMAVMLPRQPGVEDELSPGHPDHDACVRARQEALAERAAQEPPGVGRRIVDALARLFRRKREQPQRRFNFGDMTVVNRYAAQATGVHDPALIMQERDYVVASCVYCKGAVPLKVPVPGPAMQLPRCGRCGCWMHKECFEKELTAKVGAFYCPVEGCKGDRGVDWYRQQLV